GAVFLLIERRNTVAKCLATIEAVVEAALVVANAAVVLTSNDVPGVERVDLDELLRLTSERAVLIGSHVSSCAVARGTTKRTIGNGELIRLHALVEASGDPSLILHVVE